MNRFEQRAQAEKKAPLRPSTTIWTAVLALIVVVAVIIGLSTSAPPNFWRNAAIAVAILLLLLRQLTRRLQSRAARGPKTDPQSRLNLD